MVIEVKTAVTLGGGSSRGGGTQEGGASERLIRLCPSLAYLSGNTGVLTLVIVELRT